MCMNCHAGQLSSRICIAPTNLEAFPDFSPTCLKKHLQVSGASSLRPLKPQFLAQLLSSQLQPTSSRPSQHQACVSADSGQPPILLTQN
ncbi:hypothetical protein SLA2020_269400 [Shorea laevis]